LSAEWNAHALNVTHHGRKGKHDPTQVLAWAFKSKITQDISGYIGI
jgi:hypothetical protein